MQSITEFKRMKRAEKLLFLGFFLVALVLCGFINYTDGDDAYFSSMARSMSLLDYVKMRYIGWEGRVTSETMTYIAFYFGKAFWQPVNALILTLLPAGLIHIGRKIMEISGGWRSLLFSVTMYVGVLLLNARTLGYGAFWVTGSTFYLWSIVAGIWAAVPFVDLVFSRKEISRKCFWYAIPCGFIAAMGQEQIAAVIIAFGFLAVCWTLWKRRRESGIAIPWLAILELFVIIIALVVLFCSPGTGARTESEIATWMPQYQDMSVGNHLFITMQWILSSFANEGKMLFAVIWVLCLMILWRQNRGVDRTLAATCGMLALVALLPLIGITRFSEMGMGVPDITQCVTQVATPESLTSENWVSLSVWVVGVVVIIMSLWKIFPRGKMANFAILLVLAASASEAIMYFSPTMYASGARVYFVAQILLWLLAGLLSLQAAAVWNQGKTVRKRGGAQLWITVGVVAAGVIHVLVQLPVIVEYL